MMEERGVLQRASLPGPPPTSSGKGTGAGGDPNMSSGCFPWRKEPLTSPRGGCVHACAGHVQGMCMRVQWVQERVCAVRTHVHLSVPLSQSLLPLTCGVICTALCPALGNGAEGLGSWVVRGEDTLVFGHRSRTPHWLEPPGPQVESREVGEGFGGWGTGGGQLPLSA